MDINSLTIGQAKEIAAMFGEVRTASGNLAASMVGKYVIVRSRNEGLNAGYVEAADETGVILKDARRLWYHKPAVKSEPWYEGVANHGLSEDSKISGAVARKVIIEEYSMTECSEVAEKSIQKAVANAS